MQEEQQYRKQVSGNALPAAEPSAADSRMSPALSQCGLSSPERTTPGIDSAALLNQRPRNAGDAGSVKAEMNADSLDSASTSIVSPPCKCSSLQINPQVIMSDLALLVSLHSRHGTHGDSLGHLHTSSTGLQ